MIWSYFYYFHQYDVIYYSKLKRISISLIINLKIHWLIRNTDVRIGYSKSIYKWVWAKRICSYLWVEHLVYIEIWAHKGINWCTILHNCFSFSFFSCFGWLVYDLNLILICSFSSLITDNNNLLPLIFLKLFLQIKNKSVINRILYSFFVLRTINMLNIINTTSMYY